jgi:hypothetical protein
MGPDEWAAFLDNPRFNRPLVEGLIDTLVMPT